MSAPTAVTGPVVQVLGIRHHGPGSARSVLTALDELQPDVVLVEGPADADPLLALAATQAMVPPVALFAHTSGTDVRAAFWPFAVFSPEWQALRWAAEHAVAVRFCDLPTTQVLVERTPDPDATDDADSRNPDDAAPRGRTREDPIAALAAAAGQDDPERWWDDVVESQTGVVPAFAAIAEAMAALREVVTEHDPVEAEREQRREAHMRQVLRQALREGAQRVAVVCGAWHAPALTAPLPTAAADARVLRGAAKTRTTLTWVPWTHGRLATASGYGAGITSPGWYHHLFTAPDEPVARWLTAVARSLRAHDLPTSSAHVIEAVRLADTLAALRGRPRAGLSEVTDATRSVLCDGDEAALALVTRDLVVGEAMGEVPPGAPTVPLEADLRATARRLRLPLEPLGRALVLDLRRDNDVARSHLLHRLAVLDVPWGRPDAPVGTSTGTFKEAWHLRFTPELAVALVEASVWGATVPAAATARLVDRAGTATALAELTDAVERALLADLPDALGPVLAAVADRAATDRDVLHLMAALPPLVRAQRYGDVRRTDTSAVGGVLDTLLVRICTGLAAALTGLGDDAATAARESLDEVHAAVVLRADTDPGGHRRWLDTLTALTSRVDVHGLLAGRVVRLLLDAGRLDATDAASALGRALSVGPTAVAKAAWAEGFLDGTALLLVHDPALLGVLDDWVARLEERELLDVLPLLRRTFGRFAQPERRTLGEQVRRLGAVRDPADPRDAGWDVDLGLAGPVLARVGQLLGARP